MRHISNDLFQPEDLFSIVGCKKKSRKTDHGMHKSGKNFSIPHHYSPSHVLTYGLLGQMLTARSHTLWGGEAVDFQDTYYLKQIAGTFIEGIGLTSVTYSPLWHLAILSLDQEDHERYFKLLIEGFRGHGLLSVTEKPGSIDDLMDCLNARSKVNSNHQSALLATYEMTQLKNDVKKVANAHDDQAIRQKMDRVWSQMNQLVNYERIPFEKMIGIMTLDLIEKMTKEKHHIYKYSLSTVYEKYHNNMMMSYNHSMSKMSEVGRGISLMNHMTPFVQYYSL